LRTLVVLALAAVLAGCAQSSAPVIGTAAPTVVPAGEVAAVASKLNPHVRFTVTALAFLNGTLYVGTNLGLMELGATGSLQLLTWHPEDDVVNDFWIDANTRQPWLMHKSVGLLRYDGNAWQHLRVPAPKSGFTRGDLLQKFQGISSGGAFFFQAGGAAWQWDGKASTWHSVELPADSRLALIADLSGDLVAVLRHELMPGVFLSKDPKGDTLHLRSRDWQEIDNNTKRAFFVEEIVSGKSEVVFRTKEGDLYRVTPGGVDVLAGPGPCSALGVGPGDTIVGYFVGRGVYELGQDWLLRLPPPREEPSGEHFAHLASDGHAVALAYTDFGSKSDGGLDFQASRLWVRRGDTWQEQDLLRLRQAD
jgi:hypothetical protein